MIVLTDPNGWHHAHRQAWKFVLLSVLERKYFTCPSWESNRGRWIYRQTLCHVAVKAGFYRKAVEVYYIPRPCDT